MSVTTAAADVLQDTSLLLPLVICSIPIAFVLSFAIGANDVANSFGTSYGSGVLSLRMCCVLATIFETLGAITLGHNVSETIRKRIFDIGCYDREEAQLALGYLSAMIGSALWNLFATLASIPVSGTHSIIGSLLGFTLVAKSVNGIKWRSIAVVIASWFVSPAAAGLISILGYYLTYKFVLTRKPASRRVVVVQMLPLLFGLTVFVNVFSILFMGPKFMTPFPGNRTAEFLFAAAVSVLIAAIVYLIVYFYWSPKQRKKIGRILSEREALRRQSAGKVRMDSAETSLAAMAFMTLPSSTATSSAGLVDSVEIGRRRPSMAHISIGEEDAPEVAQGFRSLQILTSCFGAFAHGANDVSNAIGPLIAVYMIYQQGNVYQVGDVPVYLLLLGGAGISAGLWLLGYRVIKTIGENLTHVTPSSGFTIEFCSSFTVLLASKMGFPISTTHCKVGSVVAVGWIRDRLLRKRPSRQSDNNENVADRPEQTLVATSADSRRMVRPDVSTEKNSAVNWKLLTEIGAAWILTVPIAAAFTAFSFSMLRLLFPALVASGTCVTHHSSSNDSLFSHR